MTIVTDNTVIQTTPSDNVGIVCNAFGLEKGTSVLDNIVLIEDIPMGHKVALSAIDRDDAVIRYGQIIGYANKNIQKGEWINEDKIELPEPPDLANMPYSPLTPKGAGLLSS